VNAVPDIFALSSDEALRAVSAGRIAGHAADLVTFALEMIEPIDDWAATALAAVVGELHAIRLELWGSFPEGRR
jgi:hypothetical protein